MEEENYPEEFPEELTQEEIEEFMTQEEIDKTRIKWRDCTLSNDFLFSQVYQESTAIRGILKLLLDIRVVKITKLQVQDVIAVGYGLKSIRTDVTVECKNGKVYNIEMQAYDDDDLFRRARHHHAVIDCNKLRAGDIPSDLPDTFVIFICTKDPIGKGKPIYMTRNHAREFVNFQEVGDCLDIEDGSYTLYVNLSAYEQVENYELRKYMQFCLEGDIIKGGRYVNRLKKIVKQKKINPKMELRYMTLYVRDNVNVRRGEKRGEKRGFVDGKRVGEHVGFEKGEQNKELQMVINFLPDLSDETLAMKTRFTLEEIRKIREEHS